MWLQPMDTGAEACPAEQRGKMSRSVLKGWGSVKSRAISISLRLPAPWLLLENVDLWWFVKQNLQLICTEILLRARAQTGPGEYRGEWRESHSLGALGEISREEALELGFEEQLEYRLE